MTEMCQEFGKFADIYLKCNKLMINLAAALVQRRLNLGVMTPGMAGMAKTVSLLVKTVSLLVKR